MRIRRSSLRFVLLIWMIDQSCLFLWLSRTWLLVARCAAVGILNRGVWLGLSVFLRGFSVLSWWLSLCDEIDSSGRQCLSLLYCYLIRILDYRDMFCLQLMCWLLISTGLGQYSKIFKIKILKINLANIFFFRKSKKKKEKRKLKIKN